ncbi:sodium- and chloride-dependent creatine transporter 1-like [Haliotis rufescens]|uniref:sodium- and chloride-dependent creatine transporter 1-like n=1 Tax=Haliotis rufescens TaxID=6454 RepID=UPI00201ECFB3|nr:sodium- and chloride-dependent creatine transporter 1-like [Haliotis rufescens]
MYTSMYFSWYLYYFFNSFFNPLPWSTCGNPWNTPSCVESTLYGHQGMNTTVNGTVPLRAAINTTQSGHLNGSTDGVSVASATEEFWRFNALEISNGLDHAGSIRWPLFGCLVLTYVAMYFMLLRGIRVTGKIVYVTFMLPLILCTVILIRGSLLPGALDGLLYMIKPDFGKLKSPTMWIEACGYALHSMGTSKGIANTVSSHNQPNSNCYRLALIACVVDPLITIFCGLSIFTVLGHMAYVTGIDMDDFQSSGLFVLII